MARPLRSRPGAKVDNLTRKYLDRVIQLPLLELVMDDRDGQTPDSDRHPDANDARPAGGPEAPATPPSAAEDSDDRRRFLKGLIAGAAAASLTKAGVAHATPGRKLPYHGAAGMPSTLAFAHDLAVISGQVTEPQWQQVQTTMEQYLGPLVDTSDFLASSYNITIEGCITISGSA